MNADQEVERTQMLLAEAGYPDAEVMYVEGYARALIYSSSNPSGVVPAEVAGQAFRVLYGSDVYDEQKRIYA